jgi:hypothetical protein
MVEAHARAVAASVVPRATKGIPGRTMDMITQELLFVLEGSDGAAERCAAMESLFWLQVRENCIHCLSLVSIVFYIQEDIVFIFLGVRVGFV